MIEVNNLTNIKIDGKFLTKVAKKVLKKEKNKFELSIVLVGEKKIKQLNKKYRGKNQATDVLAFGENIKYKIPAWPADKYNTRYKIQDLGEILICLEEVKKNAREFNTTFKKELTRVLIHGILHLLGANHETSDKRAKKMREKEKYYFDFFK